MAQTPITITLPQGIKYKDVFVQKFSSRDVTFDLHYDPETMRESERQILIKDLSQVLADLHELKPKE